MLRLSVLLALAALLAAPASVVSAVAPLSYSRVDLGDRLERDFTKYVPVPSTASDAKAAGWSPLGGCEEGVGMPWAQSANGVSESQPLVLYFTPAGQASGVGTLFRGDYPQQLIDRGYLQSIGPSKYFMSVSFRSADEACSSAVSPHYLGDRLVINAGPGGIGEEVPLTRDEAVAAGWVAGSCFQGMGTHWFKDITGNRITWSAANLLPLVTMFDEQGSSNFKNAINAFFFASSVVQQSLLPPSSNEWEPIPLPNLLMCKNFCDSQCGFTDTLAYSTLHIYMRDRTPVTCNGGCTIGCCSGSAASATSAAAITHAGSSSRNASHPHPHSSTHAARLHRRLGF